MTEYYKTLGLGSDATLEEVKIAYRKLSKKFHPDVNQGDKYFEERFKEIQEAYEKIVNDKIKNKSKFNYKEPTKQNTDYSSRTSNDDKNENNIPKEDISKKNNLSKVIVPSLIIILIVILKPIIQKSIRENAERELIKTYDNHKTFEHNFQNSNQNSQIKIDSISILNNIKYDSVVNNTVTGAENKISLSESKQWILTKLNRFVTERNYFSEPSAITFPTKSRYYNYYFTISDNSLVVTYNMEHSEIVLDEETKSMYRNTNLSDDMVKRMAGKMTVTSNKNFKIVIPLQKIESIYFDEDKNYKGNCDFSISTKKNDMINYDLTKNDKTFSSYFTFEIDCSQEENLGKRLNEAFLYIKKTIPMSNKSTNEPF